MNEETKSENASTPGLPTLFGDSISEAITGIPAPIKRNFLKAFGRLCSAAVEIPVAQLEGIAAEKRAEAAARVKIIEINATQIARQMEVNPEYARVAVRKFGDKIVREQVNLDTVVRGTARELMDSKTLLDPQASQEIDDDWLTQFENEASQRGAPAMQKMFSRILAGEIQRPTTFSVRSIKILGQLDKRTAELFTRFCSACISLKVPGAPSYSDARLVSLGSSAAFNSLQEFGFSFGVLNELQENGLIISDYNSLVDYHLCVIRGHRLSLPFRFEGKLWGLRPINEESMERPIPFRGVALTKVGQELMEIVDVVPMESYRSKFIEYVRGLNFELAEAVLTQNHR